MVSLFRICQSAQDWARNSIQDGLRGYPAKLNKIRWNWTKFAGHQLHPNNWRKTLQAKLAREHKKKTCVASSEAPQRAQEPFKGPLRVAICILEGSLSSTNCQEKIFILSGTAAPQKYLKYATVAPLRQLAIHELDRELTGVFKVPYHLIRFR
jgi:hypothetical protein